MSSRGSGDAADVVLDSPLSALAGGMNGAFLVLVVAAVLLSPETAVPGGWAWLLGGLSSVLSATNWWYRVRTPFHGDLLVFERGIGPLKRTSKVGYLSVGRVHAEAWAVAVTMSLEDARTLRIANMYTRLRGESTGSREAS
mgnify:CR=1 FL=1